MAHKHNRRRIRPRQRQYLAATAPPPPLDASALVDPLPEPPLSIGLSRSIGGRTNSSSTFLPRSRSFANKSSSASSLVTQHWQNRYNAWQKREQLQQQQLQPGRSSKLEEERCRLFGGEPGEDEALCYKMLEYFGGLDYIFT